MHHLQKTIFISDLHLDESQPHITQQFLELLSSCDRTVDALYILGDFFEVWIGDDDMSPFHRRITEALNKAHQKGLNIYFLPGNRDFLIGKEFLAESRCQLLSDETVVSIYGSPVLLMHGDKLCTNDIGYQFLRALLRNRLFPALFLRLPLSARRSIANRMRRASQHYSQQKTLEKMDVTTSAVMRVMKQHHTDHLIHGHTHRPGIQHFHIGELPATRIVLGAWHEHGNMLVWDASGKKELITLGS